MLKSVTIENFFSFGEAQKIELNPGVNILIGINGSGKSNFIRAIRLLPLLSDNEFTKVFLQKWGGFDNVAFDNRNDDLPIHITYEYDANLIKKHLDNTFIPPNFYYELKIFKSGNKNYRLEAENYILDKTSQKKTILKEKSDFESIFNLSNATNDLPFYINALSNYLKNIRYYENFDVSEKSDLRNPGDSFIEDYLLPDGINLYNLLNDLNINHASAFEEIENQLRDVNPYFKNIISKPIGSKFLYYLKEKELQKAIDFLFISTGTLQYLLTLTIFYNPNRGKSILFDEPDPFLHPDMINGIAKGIKHAANTGTQMIVATHSPLLLNSYDFEDLIIFEKDHKNQTIIAAVSDETIDKWADYPVGQVWMSGNLGGMRW